MGRVRDDLVQARLDAGIMGFGCSSCAFLEDCGGYKRQGGGWSCLDACSCDPATCDRVCPRAHGFARALREIDGFDCLGLPALPAIEARPPAYVPLIEHGHKRERELEVPWAAVPLRRILGGRGKCYQPNVRTSAELRATFMVPAAAQILLIGTGPDRPIERYWSRRRSERGMLHDLAALGFAVGVAPNYSFFLNDPRTHHLHARKRSLICAVEWGRVGIPPVPVLQAVAHRDWDAWFEILERQQAVSVVAKEFQTGNAAPDRGREAIRQIALLQKRLGRKLHLIAIGGMHFREELAASFDSWTVVDSTAFMKAVHRRRAERWNGKLRWKAARGAAIEDLLDHNYLMTMDLVTGGRMMLPTPAEAQLSFPWTSSAPWQRVARPDHRLSLPTR